MSKIAIIYTCHDKCGLKETKTLFDMYNYDFDYTYLFAGSGNSLGGKYYKNMVKNLKYTVLKLPDTCNIFCIACTSFSLMYDTTFIKNEISVIRPDCNVITMIDTVIEALECFGNRITMLTPYTTLIHNNMLERLSQNFIVLSHNNLGYTTENEINKISIDQIEKEIAKLDIENVDVIFIGCSSIQICKPNIITNLEKKFKKPIVTSMQAFLWKILKYTNNKIAIYNYGFLFEKYLI